MLPAAAGDVTCDQGLFILNSGTLRLFNVTATGDASCTLAVLEPSTTAICKVSDLALGQQEMLALTLRWHNGTMGPKGARRHLVQQTNSLYHAQVSLIWTGAG